MDVQTATQTDRQQDTAGQKRATFTLSNGARLFASMQGNVLTIEAERGVVVVNESERHVDVSVPSAVYGDGLR